MADKVHYDIKWFENNMRPVIAPGLGCCSACCLRNLDEEKFCDKLKCYDDWTGDFVYWGTKIPGHGREILMGHPTPEMVEWFNKTPTEQSQKIAINLIKQITQNNMQK